MYSPFAISLSNPLIPLHATDADEIPLLCIPGAGASVTSFVEFIDALGERRPIYGLQPRGIDLAEPPHESVEAAALHNLKALAQFNGTRSIHLLGHSHGGLVAFEMALRLYEQGRPVASLTLIDTEPPETPEETARSVSTSDIFAEFVDAFESTFGKSLDIDDAVIASGQTEAFVSALHAALTRTKCLPARSTPEMLRGPLATFAAALRSRYTPTSFYPNKSRLVLVSANRFNERLKKDDDMKQREAYAAKWRRQAAEVDVWYGPGHHFSILQAPHVHSLAKWWRQGTNS